MNIRDKLTPLLLKKWKQLVLACKSVQVFQDRVWVVSISKNNRQQESIFMDTFVVSEDSFSSPMSWMHARGYSQEAIIQVNKMQRSQVRDIQVRDQFHYLIRVK